MTTFYPLIYQRSLSHSSYKYNQLHAILTHLPLINQNTKEKENIQSLPSLTTGHDLTLFI